MVIVYFFTFENIIWEKNKIVQSNNAQENILPERRRHQQMVQFSIKHRFEKNLQNNKRTAITTKRIQTERRSHKTNLKLLKKLFFKMGGFFFDEYL